MLLLPHEGSACHVSRVREALSLLDSADASLLRLWQMTAGADGTDIDNAISEACLLAQVGINVARKSVELAAQGGDE